MLEYQWDLKLQKHLSRVNLERCIRASVVLEDYELIDEFDNLAEWVLICGSRKEDLCNEEEIQGNG